MAIRVICPGCMTSFEVDDRFAGRQGACPKCGHTIKIPKEKLVIHAPDDITDGNKTRKNLAGHDARPILQERFTFTGKQIVFGCVGTVAMFLLAYGVGLAHNGWISLIVGLLGALAVAYPIANFGYMLLRDPNELDKRLLESPYERHMRAFYTALVFAASWAVFEGFIFFLGGSGLVACLYLIPIAFIGAFGAVIFFDMNLGSAALMYLIFMFVAIIGRGLVITDGQTPSGWIWNANYRAVAAAPSKPSPVKAEATPADDTQEVAPATEKDESAASIESTESEKPTLSREAPKIDPTKLRRRR